MVENNEKNAKKRSRLFGGKRQAASIPAQEAPAPAVSAAAPELPAKASVTLPAAPAFTAALQPGDGLLSANPESGAARASLFSAASEAASDEEAQASSAADTASEAQSAAAVEPGVESAAASVTIRAVTTSLVFQAPAIPEHILQAQERARAQSLGQRDQGQNREQGQGRDQGRDHDSEPGESSVRRRARRRSGEDTSQLDDADSSTRTTVVKVRTPREQAPLITEPQKVRGSTRLEAKKQRRRDGRDSGRRRQVVTESEFLARRESVEREMVIRSRQNRIQIGVLEDGILAEHYVAKSAEVSLIGNVYLGKVQNVLPSMEAAFVDIGRGRNAVLYSGEVDWEAADTGKQARKIENALKPGDTVLVQVTKDPVGHKGARLTSQISLPGRFLVYVPGGAINGISRKLPDNERQRLKKILKEVLPENVGVIVRTAAEGASEEQLTLDVKRLIAQWEHIQGEVAKSQAPALLHSEPDLLVKIVRDVFNEDFRKMVISGSDAKNTIETYLGQVAPDLLDRVEAYQGTGDAFDDYRINEQIDKALDRKVWLPSGGSLVIDRTEAMTVVDVNTGKFVGSGGNLEETVTKNNLEAAEEIVRQLRLRDIGGIIVVDFIDMVLESNRDLVLRRLIECLSRDRTKHQVAEVTSLGLVQMTRKKLGLGLLESFSEPCQVCAGRGIVVHHDPVAKHRSNGNGGTGNGGNGNNGNERKPRQSKQQPPASPATQTTTHEITESTKNALAQIAASTIPTLTGSIPVVTDVQIPEIEPVIEPAASAEASSADTDAQTEKQAQGRTSRARKRPARKTAAQRAAEAEGASADQAPADQKVADQAVTEPTQAEQKSAPQKQAAQKSQAPSAAALEFELPVAAPKTEKALDSKQVENLLDSVLESLPQPKEPGQGRRSKSRRVSTAVLSTAPEQD